MLLMKNVLKIAYFRKRAYIRGFKPKPERDINRTKF